MSDTARLDRLIGSGSEAPGMVLTLVADIPRGRFEDWFDGQIAHPVGSTENIILDGWPYGWETFENDGISLVVGTDGEPGLVSAIERIVFELDRLHPGVRCRLYPGVVDDTTVATLWVEGGILRFV